MSISDTPIMRAYLNVKTMTEAQGLSDNGRVASFSNCPIMIDPEESETGRRTYYVILHPGMAIPEILATHVERFTFRVPIPYWRGGHGFCFLPQDHDCMSELRAHGSSASLFVGSGANRDNLISLYREVLDEAIVPTSAHKLHQELVGVTRHRDQCVAGTIVLSEEKRSAENEAAKWRAAYEGLNRFWTQVVMGAKLLTSRPTLRAHLEKSPQTK